MWQKCEANHESGERGDLYGVLKLRFEDCVAGFNAPRFRPRRRCRLRNGPRERDLTDAMRCEGHRRAALGALGASWRRAPPGLGADLWSNEAVARPSPQTGPE